MKRFNKRYAALGALLVIALAGLGYALMHPTVTVRMTRDEVQSRVDARLPLHVVKLGVAYDVSRALVELRQDGRVGLDTDVDATALNRTARVTLVGSGGIAYRDGEFFLTGFKVEKAATRALDATVEPKPQGRLMATIEALATKDRKDAAIALVLAKGETVLREALENRPVYRLKDSDVWQSLAKLALRDVRIENGELVADLNVMSVLARILLYVLAGGIALALLVGVFATSGGAGLLALATLGMASDI